MIIFELKVTLLLKKSIHHLHMHEFLGCWVSRSQLESPEMKRTHYDKSFKYFVFSSLFPLERDGVYQSGRVYVMTLRSSKADTLQHIEEGMRLFNGDENLQMVAMERQQHHVSHVTELITITPTIVTVDHKPWVGNHSIELLQNRLHANAEKKFRMLYPDEELAVQQSFIQGLRLENRKPIAIAYKGKKLIGNKFKLFIQDDRMSQRLACVVLGSGLAEKNSSLGAGFCLARCV